MNLVLKFFNSFIIFSAHQFSYKEDFIGKLQLKMGLKKYPLNPEVNDLAEIGKISSVLTTCLNSNISCQKCYLDKFGSSDGISML